MRLRQPFVTRKQARREQSVLTLWNEEFMAIKDAPESLLVRVEAKRR